MSRSRFMRSRLAAVAVVLVLGTAPASASAGSAPEGGSLGAGLVVDVAASSSPGSEPKFTPPKRYHLALGDSLAYGFQLAKFVAGAPAAGFDTGYVDVFSARIRAFRPNLTVVNFGCPGETTSSFVSGPCLFRELGELHDDYAGSQLEAARSFLRAHRGQVSPITITLWSNDLGQFVRSCGGDFSCVVEGVPAAIDGFASRLGHILDELRAEAPDAEVIVTGPWNTFLGSFAETDPLFDALDRAMRQVSVEREARFAAVFPVFNPQGDPAAEAAAICAFTLLCSEGDSHPSDLGYRVIADAVFDASHYARIEVEK